MARGILVVVLLVMADVVSLSHGYCTPEMQRVALLQFFQNTGGATAWTNTTGWSDLDIDWSSMGSMGGIADAVAGLPVNMTGACMSSDGGNNTEASVQLPDHCCWFGVRCCDPSSCQEGRLSCNCTTGLVDSLDLVYNNVSSTGNMANGRRYTQTRAAFLVLRHL